MTSTNPQFWLREVTVRLNVLALLAVYNNLLLALRQPNNVEHRDLVVKFAREIGEELVFLNAMTPEQLEEAYKIEAGGGKPEIWEI